MNPMTPFQWIAVSCLSVLLIWEFAVFWRGRTSKQISLLRSLVWIAAAVTIVDPNIVQRLAVSIGIGRGADVILYLFVLAFLASSFYFYSRYVRLQRQMTQLVRHLAIREARRGSETSQRTTGQTG